MSASPSESKPARGAATPGDLQAAASTGDSGSSRGIGVTVAVVAVLLLAMGLLYVRLTTRERHHVLHARESSAVALASLLAENEAAPLDFGDAESARKTLETLNANPSVNAVAVFVGPEGAPFAAMQKPGIAPLARESPGAVRWVPEANPAQLRVAVGVFSARARTNPLLGTVVVEFSLDAENRAFVESKRSLLAMLSAMAVGLMVVLAFIVRISHVAAEQVRKTIQENLRNQELANDELIRLDKLKDEFLANTSHELRSPLHGMLGLTEAVLADTSSQLDDESRRHLEMAVASGYRLASLVNDILDFSKLRHEEIVLRHEPINLRHTVEKVLTMALPLARPKGLDLVNNVGPEVMVMADEARLEQILTNLVGNAVKFTPTGLVRVGAAIEGSRVAVRVSDTGIGIAVDALERIFESFVQGDGSTARAFGGTGLGLTVSRQLVGLHGGRIAVTSELGKGSVFAFDLEIAGAGAVAAEKPSRALSAPMPVPGPMPMPVPVPVLGGAPQPAQMFLSSAPTRPPAPTDAPQRRAQAAPPRRGRILVADDDPMNIEVLTAQLRPAGFELVAARDGQEAIDMFYSHGPFDAVLLDVMMPHLTGPEVAERIRTEYPVGVLPILMLTAKSRPEDAIIGLRAGANDYLGKPFHREELLTRLGVHIEAARTMKVMDRFLAPALVSLAGANQPWALALGQGLAHSIGFVRVAIRGLDSLASHLDESTFFDKVSAISKVVVSTFAEHGGVVESLNDHEVSVIFEAPGPPMFEASRQALKRLEAHVTREVRVSIALHAGNVKVGVLGDEQWLAVRTVGESAYVAAALGLWGGEHGFDCLTTDNLLSKLDRQPKVRRVGTGKLGTSGHPVTVYQVLEAGSPAVNLDELVDGVESGLHADVKTALAAAPAHDPLVILLLEQCATGQTRISFGTGA